MLSLEAARDFLPNSSQSTSSPASVDTENPLVTRAQQSETLMKAAETLRRLESDGDEGSPSQGTAEAAPASTHRATIAKQLEEVARRLTVHPDLSDQQRNERRESEKALLEAYPAGATEKNDGVLPLHHALQHDLPEEVVLALVRNFPEAIGLPTPDGQHPLLLALDMQASDRVISKLLRADKSAASHSTPSGKMALHIAAERGASDASLKALLAANPKALRVQTAEGDLPLHLAARAATESAVELILDSFPVAAVATGKDGYLPLHCAVSKRQSPRVVSMLVDANPDGCRVADALGNLPLHLAIEAEAPDESIAVLLDSYAHASRETNTFGKRPYDVAMGRKASPSDDALLAMLEQAEMDSDMMGAVARSFHQGALQTVDVLHDVCVNVVNAFQAEMVSAWPKAPRKTKSQMSLCDVDALYLPHEQLVTLE